MKTIYVAYHSKSSVTGRALFDKMREDFGGQARVLRCNKHEPKRKPDVMIRWGNSQLSTTAAVELNEKEKVRSASNKAEMERTLREAGVAMPPKIEDPSYQGPAYIRNNRNVVRYVEQFSGLSSSDKYALYPISNKREFRIHIYNDRTIGVYEKEPYEADTKIYKDDTCRFRRIDQGGRVPSGIRPLARQAVSALGLLFGGVDVIIDLDTNNKYVLEVNSAPALNGPNLDRWVEAFKTTIFQEEEDNVTME